MDTVYFGFPLWQLIVAAVAGGIIGGGFLILSSKPKAKAHEDER